MEILYTRLSPRHNWDLLSTNAENTTNFVNNFNSFLRDVLVSSGKLGNSWIERHPLAQIGLIKSDFQGGNLNEVDNLRPNSSMAEVWNVSDLVTKITIK